MVRRARTTFGVLAGTQGGLLPVYWGKNKGCRMLRVNRHRLTLSCALLCVPIGRGYAQSHQAPATEPLSAPLVSQSLPSQPQAGSLDNGKLLRQPSVDSFTLSSVKLTQALLGADETAITSYFDRAARTTVDSTNAAGVDYYGGFGNPLGPAFPTS
jgi:hypothetical protein